MVLYLPFCNFFALYIEFNFLFGIKPLYSKEKFKGETIIYIPYGQIIYTPSRVLKEKPRNTNVTGNKELHITIERTPKN